MKTISSLAIALALFIVGALALGLPSASALERQYPFGPLKVDVRQHWAQSRGCEGSLSVYRDKTRVHHRQFIMDPAGDYSGLFVPDNQPPGYFAVVKLGSYDGRLLLLDQTGRLRDLQGGSFLITPDKRFLIVEYRSDIPAITVFDLQNNRQVTQEELPNAVFPRRWYALPGVAHTYVMAAFAGEENKTRWFRLNAETGQISVLKGKPEGLTPLAYAFEPSQDKDCAVTGK